MKKNETTDRDALRYTRNWATVQMGIKSQEIKAIAGDLEIAHIQRHNFKLFIQELEEQLGR